MPPPLLYDDLSSVRLGIMPETLEPTLPAVSRTCSTTRLITLRAGADFLTAIAAPAAAAVAAVAIAARFATFFTVRLRAAFFPAATLFFDFELAFFVPLFAEDFFEDFFFEDFLEREDDFLVAFLDFFLAAIPFLLVQTSATCFGAER
jgi:hypothetical protein